MFSNKTYDRLKWVAQIGLPGLGTLYSVIAGFWGLPDVTQVVGSIIAVDTFLGGILAVSSKGYVTPTQGQILVDKTTPGGTLVMSYNEKDGGKLLQDVASRDAVTFKVIHAVPEPPSIRQVYPPTDTNGASA